MRLYQAMHIWFVNILLLVTGIVLLVFYVGGLIIAFIAVAK